MRDALNRILAAGHTRVVVISGRTISDLRRLLAVEPAPELWGTHGWERLEPDATASRIRAVDPLARVGLERARRALAVPEERLEVKPASVAVHVRGLSAEEEARVLAAGRAVWGPIAAESGLVLHPFDGGLELRVRGWDKGDAVREVLAEEPVGASAAYLGDDLTDEDAFAALDELGRDGRVRPLCVLVRAERRATRAPVWLRPPGELLDFLDRWNRSAR